MPHAVTIPLEEISMGGNVTTPRQASVAYCHLGLTTRLALADRLPHVVHLTLNFHLDTIAFTDSCRPIYSYILLTQTCSEK